MKKPRFTPLQIIVHIAGGLPLAATSFKYWMKRLGKNWKRLHKLVYVISPLVVLLFLLVVKGSLTQLQGNIYQPLLYGSITALLLILPISKIKLHLLDLPKKNQTLRKTESLQNQVDL